MRPDIVSLREFYRSRLGRVTTRLIRHEIERLAPGDAHGSELSVGFSLPYLDRAGVLPGATRMRHGMAFMPARQGATPWPSMGGCATVLGDDATWPFCQQQFAHVFAIHAFEFVDSGRGFLDEAWRVLAPGGVLTLVVPNRVGAWSLQDKTPFGNGRPFSRGQLKDLFHETRFEPMEWRSALFAPPIQSRFGQILLSGSERLGRVFWPAMSGVIICRAMKRLHAPHGGGKPAFAVIGPAWQPAYQRSSFPLLSGTDKSSGDAGVPGSA
ncbi:MAG: methyltransferase domain-containing protein [Pseudomonadota bacterium]